MDCVDDIVLTSRVQNVRSVNDRMPLFKQITFLFHLPPCDSDCRSVSDGRDFYSILTKLCTVVSKRND